ncbi:hypothetical protein CHS0354_008020 [Potamilus streckersoni]|uniref:Glycoside hydrolase family 31 TIM barrel domain-containing protein n=1 Tax=Potamilus streckersoni TaxID=2493646 RepID=A0AAE0T2I7_9BIVA|nr:hypothetical protein CHS0354_008020 [Potamilus streckersoni]
MLERLKSAQNSKVPVSGLWIQDWAGVLKTSFGSRLFWNWQWNSTRYPELNSTIADLKKEGIRVLAYINPYLNIEGSIFQGVKDKGYFVMNSSGQPYISDFGEFYCVTVDFTNPASYEWYKG